MICDTLARTVTAPGELPVGVLTSNCRGTISDSAN